MRIVLASTSRYRHRAVSRLGVPVECVAPDYDEGARQISPTLPLGGSPSSSLTGKHGPSRRNTRRARHRLDQIAEVDGERLQQARHPEKARAQLARLQGQEHRLLTAVAVHHGASERAESALDAHAGDVGCSPTRRSLVMSTPTGRSGLRRLVPGGVARRRPLRAHLGDDFTAVIGLPAQNWSRCWRSSAMTCSGLTQTTERQESWPRRSRFARQCADVWAPSGQRAAGDGRRATALPSPDAGAPVPSSSTLRANRGASARSNINRPAVAFRRTVALPEAIRRERASHASMGSPRRTCGGGRRRPWQPLVRCLPRRARVQVTDTRRPRGPAARCAEVAVGAVHVDSGPTGCATFEGAFQNIAASASPTTSPSTPPASSPATPGTAARRRPLRRHRTLRRRDRSPLANASGPAGTGTSASTPGASTRPSTDPSACARSAASLGSVLRDQGLRGLASRRRRHPHDVEGPRDFFRDPRLLQPFGRYATTAGRPVVRARDLNVVAHVEREGVWTVRGGMYRLAEAVAALAVRKGASFRYGAHVAEVLVRDGRAAGVKLADGERPRPTRWWSTPTPRPSPTALRRARAAKAWRREPGEGRSLSAVTTASRRGPTGSPGAHNVFFCATTSAGSTN